jgi:hypothetical protein
VRADSDALSQAMADLKQGVARVVRTSMTNVEVGSTAAAAPEPEQVALAHAA